MPATLEHHAGRGGRASDRYANEAKYVAEATHCFITVLDTLKLDMRAKDQVAPALGDLLVALHKVTRVPKDFAGYGDRAKVDDEIRYHARERVI